MQGRGGKGVLTLQYDRRRGTLVGALIVGLDDELYAITSTGGVIRTSAREVRKAGRQTKGVRLMNLGETSTLLAVARNAEDDADDPAAPGELTRPARKRPRRAPPREQHQQDPGRAGPRLGRDRAARRAEGRQRQRGRAANGAGNGRAGEPLAGRHRRSGGVTGSDIAAAGRRAPAGGSAAGGVAAGGGDHRAVHEAGRQARPGAGATGARRTGGSWRRGAADGSRPARVGDRGTAAGGEDHGRTPLGPPSAEPARRRWHPCRPRPCPPPAPAPRSRRPGGGCRATTAGRPAARPRRPTGCSTTGPRRSSRPRASPHRPARRREPPPATPAAGPASRGTRPPRQAALQLKRLDPWSVLKLALVLAVVLFFIWLVAVGVLYGVLDGMGVWDRLNGTYADLVSGEAQTGNTLISAGRVFGLAAVVGAINSLLFAVAVTVGAFVYNVSADLVGGIEVTLSERD